MFTEADARRFADEWLQAWNSHDLDAIMSHYAPDVVLTSPAAAKLLNVATGTIHGREALRGYFKQGLEIFPNLKFEVLDIMLGISSIILYYTNQKSTRTGEFMELDARQKIVRVVANYSG